MKKLPFKEVMRRVHERDEPENEYLAVTHLVLNRLYAQQSAGIVHRVEMEDLARWGLMSPNGELRPDTTEYQSESYGKAVWKLILSLWP